jgi:hypothetical protein
LVSVVLYIDNAHNFGWIETGMQYVIIFILLFVYTSDVADVCCCIEVGTLQDKENTGTEIGGSGGIGEDDEEDDDDEEEGDNSAITTTLLMVIVVVDIVM